MKKIVNEFVEWARECGEDALYIFDNTDEAIEKFLKQREEDLKKNSVVMNQIKTLDQKLINKTDKFFSVIRKFNDFRRIEPISFENDPVIASQEMPIFKHNISAKKYCQKYNLAISNGKSFDEARDYALQLFN